MRIFVFALLLFFLANVASAEQKHHCVLENTEFCGRWEGANWPSVMFVYGTYIKWLGAHPFHADCKVLKEERYDDTPYSLLKCDMVYTLDHRIQHNPEYVLLKLHPITRAFRYDAFDYLDCAVPGVPDQPRKAEDRDYICQLNNLATSPASSQPYSRH